MARITRVPATLLFGAVLVVAACGGGGTTAAPTTGGVASQPASAPASAPASQAAAACADSTDAGTVNVEIKNFAFSPDPVQAKVGDVVAWTNQDSQGHSAVIGDTGCSTDTLGQGETGAIVFTAAGTYDYVCGIHPAMTGTVEVQ